jgi:hypothetical protein
MAADGLRVLPNAATALAVKGAAKNACKRLERARDRHSALYS